MPQITPERVIDEVNMALQAAWIGRFAVPDAVAKRLHTPKSLSDSSGAGRDRYWKCLLMILHVRVRGDAKILLRTSSAPKLRHL